jgi:hypothetical protein
MTSPEPQLKVLPFALPCRWCNFSCRLMRVSQPIRNQDSRSPLHSVLCEDERYI